MRWQSRVARGEEGTSLVLALAFMSLFGVFAGLLAQFGAESFKTVSAVRDQRSTVYAAEGAVDTAIGYVGKTPGLGQNGGTCLSGSGLSLGSVAGQQVKATCTGQPPHNGGVAASLPAQALLTTATGNEDGISVSAWLRSVDVSGGVFSNSSITGTGTFDAGSSPVTARGSCTNWWFTVAGNPVTCDVGAGGHAEGNDPNYPSPLAALPTHQTVPACPSHGNKVVTFAPGFYDDDQALSDLTDGGCHNAVLWFQPGTYYFDFDWQPGDSSHTWNLDDTSVNVVGGTPKGWSPTSSSRPSIPSPGACKSDADPAPNDGVRFVFGGDSNVWADRANVELCATPDATGRELAIYGQKTGGTAAPVTTTLEPAPNGAGVSGISGWNSPLSPSNALNAIDGIVTSKSISGRNRTAALTTKSYSTSSLPAGATFTSAALQVAHRESSPSDVASITAKVSGPGGTCTFDTSSPSELHEHQGSIGTDGPLPLAGCVDSIAELSGVTVTYTVKLSSHGSPSSVVDLDGIEIDVTTATPALRAESGCVTQPGGCDLVHLDSGFSGSFVVNGTVYAPNAHFALDLGGGFFGSTADVEFTRGVVLRSIAFSNPPSHSSDPTVSVPPSGRTVVFEGYVGPERRVRAVVDFTDNPTPGSQADVTSWSVSR